MWYHCGIFYAIVLKICFMLAISWSWRIERLNISIGFWDYWRNCWCFSAMYFWKIGIQVLQHPEQWCCVCFVESSQWLVLIWCEVIGTFNRWYQCVMMYFRQRVLLWQSKYVGVDIILVTWKFIQEYFAGNQTFVPFSSMSEFQMVCSYGLQWCIHFRALPLLKG